MRSVPPEIFWLVFTPKACTVPVTVAAAVVMVTIWFALESAKLPAGTVLSNHEPLPSIPPLEFRTGVRLNGTIETVRWNAELSARILTSQDRIARSLAETTTPGFTVWNLRTYWQLTNQLTLVAGVENFTDKTYREHFDFRSQNPNARSFLQPGRNFYIGTTLVY